MKKVSIFLIVCLLLLTGCNKKVKEKTNIDYGEKVYQVYTPYKEEVSSYLVDSDIIRTDFSYVDKILMNYSKDYYDPNNYYYQSGQYLTTDILKKLLSPEKLNNKKASIDGTDTTHNFISYLYEQNYLNSDGNIKGISIMMGLNKYYKIGDDVKELDSNTVLEIGKAKANELVSYIHSMENMGHVDVVVGLFMAPYTSDLDSGSLEYIGINNKNTVDFKKVSYGEYYVTSDYVSKNDSTTFQNFRTIESAVKDNFKGLSISCKCIYKDNILTQQLYTINTTYKDNNEVMAINRVFIEEYNKLFSKDINLNMVIKENGKTVSLLTKTGDVIESKLIEND